MSTPDLGELRALLQAATPRPWVATEVNGLPIVFDTNPLPEPVVYDHELTAPNAAIIAAAVNALPALLDDLEAARESLCAAESERDAAQEHVAYHLADYTLNSGLTGDLAVDMASWAGRLRVRAESAESAANAAREEIAALIAQRDRAERRHERLESGVEALARELLAFDCIDDLVPSDVDVPDDFEHGVRDSGHRLRTLLADTTDPRRTDAATTNGAHDEQD